MSYNPMASSLTRQAWEYQQTLIDMMGEGLGDSTPTSAPGVAIDSSIDLQGANLALAVGGVAVLAAAVGASAKKFGVISTALGVLAGAFVAKRL